MDSLSWAQRNLKILLGGLAIPVGSDGVFCNCSKLVFHACSKKNFIEIQAFCLLLSIKGGGWWLRYDVEQHIHGPSLFSKKIKPKY